MFCKHLFFGWERVPLRYIVSWKNCWLEGLLSQFTSKYLRVIYIKVQDNLVQIKSSKINIKGKKSSDLQNYTFHGTELEMSKLGGPSSSHGRKSIISWEQWKLLLCYYSKQWPLLSANWCTFPGMTEWKGVGTIATSTELDVMTPNILRRLDHKDEIALDAMPFTT